MKRILIPLLIVFGFAAHADVKLISPNAGFVVGRQRLTDAKPANVAIQRPVFTDISKLDVDLMPAINSFGLGVRNQGSTRGTCSVHALTFLIEYETKKRQTLNLASFPTSFSDLSEEYLNAVTNMATGSTDDGDFFFNINQGHQKYGHLAQSAMPNKSTFDPSLQPDDADIQAGKQWIRMMPIVIKENANFTASTADDAQPFGLSSADLEKVLDLLKNNRAVAAGFRWPGPGKFATEKVAGVELMKNLLPSDLTSGHSIVLVGYRKHAAYPGGGYFVFRNSWGTGFGDAGYGYMSFAYVKANVADVMAYAAKATPIKTPGTKGQ
jgi:hypothetical protein